VGLPGERVTIRDGGIYINDDLLEEPYANGRTPGRYKVDLQPRQYFVIGDNRALSEHRERFDWEMLGKVLF
jgi:signal peptidase I